MRLIEETSIYISKHGKLLNAINNEYGWLLDYKKHRVKEEILCN